MTGINDDSTMASWVTDIPTEPSKASSEPAMADMQGPFTLPEISHIKKSFKTYEPKVSKTDNVEKSAMTKSSPVSIRVSQHRPKEDIIEEDIMGLLRIIREGVEAAYEAGMALVTHDRTGHPLDSYNKDRAIQSGYRVAHMFVDTVEQLGKSVRALKKRRRLALMVPLLQAIMKTLPKMTSALEAIDKEEAENENKNKNKKGSHFNSRLDSYQTATQLFILECQADAIHHARNVLREDTFKQCVATALGFAGTRRFQQQMADILLTLLSDTTLVTSRCSCFELTEVYEKYARMALYSIDIGNQRVPYRWAYTVAWKLRTSKVYRVGTILIEQTTFEVAAALIVCVVPILIVIYVLGYICWDTYAGE